MYYPHSLKPSAILRKEATDRFIKKIYPYFLQTLGNLQIGPLWLEKLLLALRREFILNKSERRASVAAPLRSDINTRLFRKEPDRKSESIFTRFLPQNGCLTVVRVLVRNKSCERALVRCAHARAITRQFRSDQGQKDECFSLIDHCQSGDFLIY